jgi:hypothetical protein
MARRPTITSPSAEFSWLALDVFDVSSSASGPGRFSQAATRVKMPATANLIAPATRLPFCSFLTTSFGQLAKAQRANRSNLANLLFHFDFHPAVLRSPFFGFVLGDRFTFAEPLSRNAGAIDAFLYNVVSNRIHPAFR